MEGDKMQKQNFNSNWAIRKNGGSLAMPNPHEPQPERVNLPHDAMISTARSKESPAGGAGAFFQGENIEYSKRFFVPETDKGNISYLEFEGVQSNASVWINGEYAGSCPYGYTDFILCITDFLNYGDNNTVTVYAKNAAQPNSRWYTGTGIYRSVHYITGPALHISPDGVRIITLDADSELAVVEVASQITHVGNGFRSGCIRTTLMGPDGTEAAWQEGSFHIKSNETIILRQRFTLEKPRLWSAEDPNLYTCLSVLGYDGAEIDECRTTFGIRKLQLDAVHGLRINGKTVKLRGGCIHHDSGFLGAATYYDAEERRARKLKEAGYNAIRSAHNPLSPAMLTACDKVGLYVMDEFTDVWTQSKQDNDYAASFVNWWEKDIDAMVRKDYNHPCVVLYSIGNEIPETGSLRSASWGRRIAEKFRALDPSRYITNGINVMLSIKDHIDRILQDMHAQNTARDEADINEAMASGMAYMDKIRSHPLVDEVLAESCGVLDVVGYNYASERYESDHEKYPHRVIVGSETGGNTLDKNWALVKKLGCVIGDFCWTAWDYLGEVGIGRTIYEDDAESGFYGGYPWISAFCGDFDLTGYRLPISYWRETVWNGRNGVPYIAVQKPERFMDTVKSAMWGWTDSVSSWTWPGFEGKPVRVEVYSDAEEVELFINGVSHGRRPVGTEQHQFYAVWETTYAPGTVEAVAYHGGIETGRCDLSTAGTPKIHLKTERNSLRAGTEDLLYVDITLEDARGVLNTGASAELTVCVDGPAILLGSGSGNPITEESYLSATHKTYYGRMQAILRAGDQPGMASIRVTAEGMSPALLEIPVVGT